MSADKDTCSSEGALTPIDEIARCRKEFLDDGIDPRGRRYVRDVIADSWIRSREIGLDPKKSIDPPQCSESELEAILQKNCMLLDCSAPFVNKLQELVNDTKYVIALYDSSGMILDMRGSREMIAANASKNVMVGSVSTEQNFGTCAHGLCLILEEPVTVRGVEHYNENYIGSNCAAAPIFSPEGDLVGVLTMESIVTDQQLYKTLEWVTIIAWAIQERLAHFRERDLTSKTDARKEMLASSDDEAAIVVDADGMVVLANHYARRLFRHIRGSLIGRSYESLLGYRTDLTLAARTKHDIQYLRLRIPQIDEWFLVRFIPGTLLTPPGRGVVIRMRPLETVRNVVRMCANAMSQMSLDELVINNPKALNFFKGMATSQAREGDMLVLGEAGSGRRTLAAALHHELRQGKNIFVVDCKALDAEMLHFDLFGNHGGVTNLAEEKDTRGIGLIGKWDLAQHGTLLLTDIEYMPPSVQRELLDHLEKRLETSEEAGWNRGPYIIATCSPEALRTAQLHGGLSKMLLDMLASTKISIPNLAARQEDILDLANLFLRRYSLSEAPLTLSEEACKLLKRYSWPGNIIELQESMFHAVCNCSSTVITPNCLPARIVTSHANTMLLNHDEEMTLAQMEQFMIERLMAMTDDTQSIASILGIGRTTLYRKIREYGIETPKRHHREKSKRNPK